ncbi:hypothetical protein BDV98DRAFT_484119, partial [Pterulicium gracile]
PRSCCAADTILPGLNYLKGQKVVLAKADEEYPDWLWSIMEPREWKDDGPGGRKEKADRKRANKQRLRENNFMKTQ